MRFTTALSAAHVLMIMQSLTCAFAWGKSLRAASQARSRGLNRRRPAQGDRVAAVRQRDRAREVSVVGVSILPPHTMTKSALVTAKPPSSAARVTAPRAALPFE